jgi:hypothetical protein
MRWRLTDARLECDVDRRTAAREKLLTPRGRPSFGVDDRFV